MRYKRRSRKPLKQFLIAKLDNIFSEYVRKSNIDESGLVKCFTCDFIAHYKKMQAGHYIKRSYKSLRWNLKNVKPQCPRCNMYLDGNQDEFAYQLNLLYGVGTSDELSEIKRIESAKPELYKITSEDLIIEIDRYKEKLKKLNQEKGLV